MNVPVCGPRLDPRPELTQPLPLFPTHRGGPAPGTAGKSSPRVSRRHDLVSGQQNDGPKVFAQHGHSFPPEQPRQAVLERMITTARCESGALHSDACDLSSQGRLDETIGPDSDQEPNLPQVGNRQQCWLVRGSSPRWVCGHNILSGDFRCAAALSASSPVPLPRAPACFERAV